MDGVWERGRGSGGRVACARRHSHQASQTIRASAWMDTKIVTNLCTTNVRAVPKEAETEVKRWCPVKRERENRETLEWIKVRRDARDTYCQRNARHKQLTLNNRKQNYGERMGGVDQADRNIAYFSVRLNKCVRRWQRTIFFWLIGACLHNTLVIVIALWNMLNVDLLTDNDGNPMTSGDEQEDEENQHWGDFEALEKYW